MQRKPTPRPQLLAAFAKAESNERRMREYRVQRLQETVRLIGLEYESASGMEDTLERRDSMRRLHSLAGKLVKDVYPLCEDVDSDDVFSRAADEIRKNRKQ